MADETDALRELLIIRNAVKRLWGIDPGEVDENEFWQLIRDFLFYERRQLQQLESIIQNAVNKAFNG